MTIYSFFKLSREHNAQQHPDRNIQPTMPQRFVAYAKSSCDFKKTHLVNSRLIWFSQTRLYHQALNDTELSRYVQKYNGLCDLICNYVMVNDLLGQDLEKNVCMQPFAPEKVKYTLGPNPDYIQVASNIYEEALLNIDNLKSKMITHSHILESISTLQLLHIFFTNKFPYSIFPSQVSFQQNCRVNAPILENALNRMVDGSYIKFLVYNKLIFHPEGHSLLIKKTGSTFSFFDPNKGEFFSLSFPELCEHINAQMKSHDATHMAFLDGKSYQQHIERQIKSTMLNGKNYNKAIKHC